MPTKAELELAIEDLKDEVLTLHEQKGIMQENVKRAEQAVKNYDILLRGLTLWNAHASPASPLCVASGRGEESDFTLTIYAEDGVLNGVVIGDENGRIRHAAGLIPADAVLEDLGLVAL